MLRAWARKSGSEARVRSWSVDRERATLSLIIGPENRWCAHVQRFHRSNGISLRADLRPGRRCLVQHCFDADCRAAGFRGSNELPIPPEVYPPAEALLSAAIERTEDRSPPAITSPPTPLQLEATSSLTPLMPPQLQVTSPPMSCLPLQLEGGRSRLQLEVDEDKLNPELEAMLKAAEGAGRTSEGGISEVMTVEGGSSKAMREAADATSRPSLLQTNPQAELQAELQAERLGEIGEADEMGGGMDGGVGEQKTQAPALAVPGVKPLGPAAAWPAGGVGDGGDGGVGDGHSSSDGGDGGVVNDDDDDAFWRDEQALAQIDEIMRRSVEVDAQRCGRSG